MALLPPAASTAARALALATALVVGASCAPMQDEAPTAPLVVATIFPVADLVSRVAGDAVEVETLLPPRASIHTWEATPAQIRSLSRAAGYVTVGAGLDGWMEGLAADAPGLRTLRLTEGLPLLRAEEGHAHGDEDHDDTSGDPHVWLDPVLVRDDLLPRITALLVALVPAETDALEARSAALADSLTTLDAMTRTTLKGAPQRAFIATHEGWSYYARRYGLTPLGSLYEGPGHEPSARGLASLVDAAREAGLHAVLTEPQMAETAARALAGEVGAQVVVVDPLGGPGLPGRESYLDLMRFNAHAFAQALRVP